MMRFKVVCSSLILTSSLVLSSAASALVFKGPDGKDKFISTLAQQLREKLDATKPKSIYDKGEDIVKKLVVSSATNFATNLELDSPEWVEKFREVGYNSVDKYGDMPLLMAQGILGRTSAVDATGVSYGPMIKDGECITECVHGSVRPYLLDTKLGFLIKTHVQLDTSEAMDCSGKDAGGVVAALDYSDINDSDECVAKLKGFYNTASAVTMAKLLSPPKLKIKKDAEDADAILVQLYEGCSKKLRLRDTRGFYDIHELTAFFGEMISSRYDPTSTIFTPVEANIKERESLSGNEQFARFVLSANAVKNNDVVSQILGFIEKHGLEATSSSMFRDQLEYKVIEGNDNTPEKKLIKISRAMLVAMCSLANENVYVVTAPFKMMCMIVGAIEETSSSLDDGREWTTVNWIKASAPMNAEMYACTGAQLTNEAKENGCSPLFTLKGTGDRDRMCADDFTSKYSKHLETALMNIDYMNKTTEGDSVR